MLLNHSSSPKLKNVAFTSVVGPNNKPLIIGYATKDIPTDDPLRYEYNGSKPGLYDTMFPERKTEIIMAINDLDIDIMLSPVIPEDI